jgi:hypothetical protein
LLAVQALDIEETVGIDLEDGESRVHHARWRATNQLDDGAGLAYTLSSKVRYSGHVFLSKHSHEGSAGQSVQRVVFGKQEQLR